MQIDLRVDLHVVLRARGGGVGRSLVMVAMMAVVVAMVAVVMVVTGRHCRRRPRVRRHGA